MRSAVVAALAVAVVLAGCSGDVDERGVARSGATGSPATTDGGSAQVRLVVSPPATTVVAATSDGARALEVSRTLYAAAPTVVLAAAADAPSQRRAATVAEGRGVPLLLTSDVNTATRVGQEVSRLHASTLVTFGTEATRWALGLGGFRVVADPSATQLPEVRRAAPSAGLVALTRRGDDSVAATATARAAGARVVPVSRPDPRRDRTAIVALAAEPVGTVIALGRSFGAARRLRRRLDVAATGAELPGGGQVLLPGRRLVALYGHPNARALGSLGEQPQAASIRRAKRLAADYGRVSTEPVLPAFELITTIASGGAGSDRNYSNEKKIRDIRPWVEAAGKAGVYVVLDLQPGRANFLTQAKRYETLLVLPHVGLGLDPEWRLKDNQVHGRQVGTVTAREINRTTAWLAELSARHNLPQKLVVLHQFRLQMISQRRTLDASHDELAILIQMDGFGAPGTKLATWRAVLHDPPWGVWFGWKNFIDEDKPTFTPARTVRLDPSPVFVSYQ